ncbi:hypothetical protein H5T53_04995 [Candidatus Bipolaricaulota bacterium]|nr:hypothetical protein [Candidatus Bipolaricaulota bacterium]
MRLLTRLVAGGGVAAFFFFSWVIMMLWNSIVAGHLGIYPALSYLQACGLWFLLILLFSWAGIGATWRLKLAWRRQRRWEEYGRDIETKIKRGLARWAGAEEAVDWDELGERLERRIKEKFREWLKEE